MLGAQSVAGVSLSARGRAAMAEQAWIPGGLTSSPFHLIPKKDPELPHQKGEEDTGQEAHVPYKQAGILSLDQGETSFHLSHEHGARNLGQ